MSWIPQLQYRRVAPNENDSKKQNENAGETPLLEGVEVHHPVEKSYRSYLRNAIPWALSTFLLCVMVFLSLRPGCNCHGTSATFESGFNTDLESAKPEIEIVQTRFYGAINYGQNGTFYITKSPDEPPYVGHPSKEIDQAWYDLLNYRYVALTDAEAFEIEKPDYWGPKDHGSFWASPDVLHTLHCVNYLRKSFNAEYYPNILVDKVHQPTHRMHIDHCLEMIRQNIQCHGDLTPIPRPFNGGAGWLADGNRVHTCRNFRRIPQWTKLRWDTDRLETEDPYKSSNVGTA